MLVRCTLALVLLAVTQAGPAFAADAAAIARGGLLYDKWFAVVEAKAPSAANAVYPKGGKYYGNKGGDYRCKECHGWDYRGKDGAYAKGKHFTGFGGIRGMAGAKPKAIITVLTDRNHGYNRWLKPADLKDLALFIAEGQVDMDRVIDRGSKKAKGDIKRGAGFYKTVCAKCHGLDGKGEPNMDDLGAVARKNPWETLHKILNGQPKEPMPALRAFDLQISVDILAYAQTL
jgi:cytochrome c5